MTSQRPQSGEVGAGQPSRGGTLVNPAVGGSPPTSATQNKPNPFERPAPSTTGASQSTKSSDNPFVDPVATAPAKNIATSHYASALVSQLHPNTQNSQGFTGCWAPFNQCVWNSPVSQLAQCQQTYNQCMSSNSSPPPSSGNPFISSSPATASPSTSGAPPTIRPVSQRAVNQVVQSRDAYFQQLSGQLDGYVNASIAVLDNNVRQLLTPAPAGSVVVLLANPPSNPTGSFNDDESDDMRNLLNEVLDEQLGQQGYLASNGSPQGSPTDNGQSSQPVAAQPPTGTTQNDANGGDPTLPPPDSAAPATNAPSVSAGGNPFAENPANSDAAPPPEVAAGANTAASDGSLGWAQQGLSNVAQQAAAGASSAYDFVRKAIDIIEHPTVWVSDQVKSYFCNGIDPQTSCPANQTTENFYDSSATAINNRAETAADNGQAPPPGLEADPSAVPNPSPTPDPATNTDSTSQ